MLGFGTMNAGERVATSVLDCTERSMGSLEGSGKGISNLSLSTLILQRFVSEPSRVCVCVCGGGGGGGGQIEARGNPKYYLKNENKV
jgi:hypothetical protein